MRKKNSKICLKCTNEYHGQGKLYCSKECRIAASIGKPQKKRSEETKEKIRKSKVGFKHSEESKIKISKSSKKMWDDESYKEQQKNSRKGRIQSEETKKKISDAQKGVPRPSTTHYNLTRPKVSGWHHSEESKAKISKGTSGSNNGMYGKIPKFKNIGYYENNNLVIKMRSSWEIKFAFYLDSQNKDWEYESHTFRLSDGSNYTPDFYSEGIFYEVKGYPHIRSIEKMKMFIEEYPDKTLELVDKEYLLGLNIKL